MSLDRFVSLALDGAVEAALSALEPGVRAMLDLDLAEGRARLRVVLDHGEDGPRVRVRLIHESQRNRWILNQSMGQLCAETRRAIGRSVHGGSCSFEGMAGQPEPGTAEP